MSSFSRGRRPKTGDRKEGRLTGRALHRHLLDAFEEARGMRTWVSLAREAGVPQSTLATQLSRRKFSLDVACRLARVLDLDLGRLLEPPNRESDSR